MVRLIMVLARCNLTLALYASLLALSAGLPVTSNIRTAIATSDISSATCPASAQFVQSCAPCGQGCTVLAQKATADAKACCALCASTQGCQHWTFNPQQAASCHLKSGVQTFNWAAFCTSSGPPPSPPSPPSPPAPSPPSPPAPSAAQKIFGMYQPSTAMNGFANSGLWNSVAEAMAARGMPGSTFTRNALNLQNMGFCTPTPYSLAPNYQQLFNQQAPLFQALQRNGTIAILFLGDELRCHGMPTADIDKYAQAAKASCPACLVYVNECSGTFEKSKYSDYKVPNAVDLLSIDYYPTDFQNDWVNDEVVPFYHKSVFPKMPSHTKFIFVSLASGWYNKHPNEPTKVFKEAVHNLRKYADYCASHGRCAGMMPWYWAPYPVSPACPKCNLGCSTNNDCVAAAQYAGRMMLSHVDNHQDRDGASVVNRQEVS